MMALEEIREIIVEYWLRVLLSSPFSHNDIVKVMLEFSDEFEYFDPSISSHVIKYSHDKRTIGLKREPLVCGESAFGAINAKPGGEYYWELKLLKNCLFVNIGIVEADKLLPNQGYWSNGIKLYHSGEIKYYSKGEIKYGDKVTKGDIIEICLDLKEKYSLSYSVNSKDLGQIPYDVKKNKTYKLAIGFYQKGKISLLSCKIK